MIGRFSFAPGRQANGTNASMRPNRVLLAATGLLACGSEPVAANSTDGGSSSSTAVTDAATVPEPTSTSGGEPGEWRGILGPQLFSAIDPTFRDCTSNRTWEPHGLALASYDGNPLYVEIAGVEHKDSDGNGIDELVISEFLAGPCDPRTCAPIVPGADCSGCYGPCHGTVMGCDEWAQDCGPGEKCVPYSRYGLSAYDSTRCVPVAADPTAPGEDCMVQDHPTSGLDDCDAKSICWRADPLTLMSECVEMCTGSAETPTCSEPAIGCITASDGVLHLCFPSCDPLAPNCDPDEVCIPSYPDQFRCARDESGVSGQAFEDCELDTACDPGLLCSSSAFAVECNPGATGCCLPFCDLDAPACPGVGQVCMSWYQQIMAPAGLENVGICRIPP